MMAILSAEKKFDIFSRFDKVRECDDGRTDGHQSMTYTALCLMSHGKKVG